MQRLHHLLHCFFFWKWQKEDWRIGRTTVVSQPIIFYPEIFPLLSGKSVVEVVFYTSGQGSRGAALPYLSRCVPFQALAQLF